VCDVCLEALIKLRQHKAIKALYSPMVEQHEGALTRLQYSTVNVGGDPEPR
jgi:hypothetical protein